jgi:hypothetical protein
MKNLKKLLTTLTVFAAIATVSSASAAPGLLLSDRSATPPGDGGIIIVGVK